MHYMPCDSGWYDFSITILLATCVLVSGTGVEIIYHSRGKLEHAALDLLNEILKIFLPIFVLQRLPTKV